MDSLVTVQTRQQLLRLLQMCCETQTADTSAASDDAAPAAGVRPSPHAGPGRLHHQACSALSSQNGTLLLLLNVFLLRLHSFCTASSPPPPPSSSSSSSRFRFCFTLQKIKFNPLNFLNISNCFLAQLNDYLYTRHLYICYY